MSLQVCVLGSGSRGNCTLLMAPGLNVLIDAGFSPDELARRMHGTGAEWSSIDAILVTHLHGDHIRKKCFSVCAEHNIQLFCHQDHLRQLAHGRYFKKLEQKGLVRTHDGATPFELRSLRQKQLLPGLSADSTELLEPLLRFQAIPLSHDAEPTFGYRVEARVPPKAHSTGNGIEVVAQAAAAYPKEDWKKLAYLADLGECTDAIARAICDVDVLALEFNHDEQMERRSGRHPALIERVLSRWGHLSNSQAADVFRRVLESNGNGGPKLLLQMHLSEDCNRPELAYQAAQQVVLFHGAQTRVYSTRQDQRGTVHTIH